MLKLKDKKYKISIKFSKFYQNSEYNIIDNIISIFFVYIKVDYF